MSKRLPLLLFSGALAISYLLYSSTIDYYFFQDDFFHLNISQANNFDQFLNFFKFRSDIIGYRPISLQLYFFFPQKLFGLDPAAFRLVSFSLLFLSFFLITNIFKKISGKTLVGLITAALWITSAIHFMPITWISAGYIIIGTFFWLLTSYFFLKFVSKGNKSYYTLSVLSFLLTLASNEFSITWPAVFGFYYFIVLRNPSRTTLKVFAPFLFFTTLYVLAKLTFMKVPGIPEYKLAVNIDSVKALFWYFLWSFNIPEEFKKQIVDSLLIFNPKFFSEYKALIAKSFFGVMAVISFGIVYPLLCAGAKRILANSRILLFSFVWFLIGISPVLLLPNHTFSMYLSISSLGLYFLIAYLMVNFSSKKLIPVIFLIWISSSFVTLSFYKINYWMIESQRFARQFALDMKSQLPSLHQNAVVLYHLSDHRHLQALLNDNAIRAIYNDDSLSIYYNKESLLSDINNLKGRPIYIFVPK